MTTGDLRERIYIQRRSTTADAQGGRAVAWLDLVTGTTTGRTLAASVEPMAAGERVAAAAIGSHQKYTAVIRYRADVTPAMRISWRPFRHTTAKTLEIHTVQFYEGQRVFLTLACSEVL